jgi:hypothetical protein
LVELTVRPSRSFKDHDGAGPLTLLNMAPPPCPGRDIKNTNPAPNNKGINHFCFTTPS